MATSIRLDDDFVEEVKVHAEAMSRSVPKQVEYQAKIGERKKGNLNYLWVHKFHISNQQYLLSYRWVDAKIEIYLLSLGSHEIPMMTKNATKKLT
ncbi:TA system antitoxin ParD family protein [Pectobacterium araliae]|uniref:TA system antitoxin ParD family protein n=1 Tax=Pectobacterium araliae TaxID=3073862 RepID=UPI003CE4C78D